MVFFVHRRHLALFRVCLLGVVHNCHVAVFSWAQYKKNNLHNNINNNNGNDNDDDDDQRNSCKLQLTSWWRHCAADCENVLELCIKWWAGLFAAAAVSSPFSLPASFKVVQFVLTKSNGKFYKFP